MRHTAWRLLAIASLLTPAVAAMRPHYGGTLRVQMRSQPTTLEESLAGLVFDSLVTFNDSGQPQPALAIAWKHDGDFKRWEFQIRPGVKFHDGNPLTAGLVAAALKPLGASAHGETILVSSEQPAPNLLYVLARSSISKDASMTGTGPFRVTVWDAGRRAVFAANEEYWAGRPYADSIEVEMGRSLRNQALDLDLNKADIVELGLSDTRRKRVWTSPPVDLLALVCQDSTDTRAREALALSIDRATIHNVILQKQGVPAGALLPQWLSGYAFLFPVERDLDRARELARAAAALTLAYNPADGTARLIAERIAVNAREAGLNVRPVPMGAQKASAHLIHARINWPDAGHALGSVAAALGVQPPAESSPQTVYAAEAALLRDHRIIPLFHLPEMYGLGPRVRGWAPSRWGGMKLDSVWLAP